MAKNTITAKELHQRLSYDPKTGIFRSKIKRGILVVGQEVGCINNGYTRVVINYKAYYAHRLAWLYMTGKWPVGIDHKNGNRRDNRWRNLRQATYSQNHQNKSILSNNKSGYKGVQPSPRIKNRWIATIKPPHSKIKYLGTFDCPKKAHKAYVNAAKRYFGEFARAG